MFATKLLNSYGNPNPVGDKEIQGNWKDLDFFFCTLHVLLFYKRKLNYRKKLGINEKSLVYSSLKRFNLRIA
jgi:hypothetical protein